MRIDPAQFRAPFNPCLLKNEHFMFEKYGEKNKTFPFMAYFPMEFSSTNKLIIFNIQ